ncbi:MAG: TRM11 family SAM-dependent methyltransferase [Candidatus Woesearchaeota archaeon]
MYLLRLSKENIALSIAEVIALFGKGYFYDSFFLIDSKVPINNFKRLSYTKSIYKVFFSFSYNQIIKIVQKYKWDKILKKSYKISFLGFKDNFDNSKVNNTIWKSLYNPKVSMTSPFHQIYFIKIGSKCFCCEKILDNNENFISRSPQNRLKHIPISLKPNLARCLVNLSGCKDKRSKIVDPFSGTGGILIEASLLGLNVKGYDISKSMISIAKLNCRKYKNIDLSVKDFFDLKKTMYIVSELPFGKNTKKLSDNFYVNFVNHLSKILVKRAVIVFPGTVNVKKLFNNTELILVDVHYYYVHKSMTRQICVVEKL